MANTNKPLGFKPAQLGTGVRPQVTKWVVAGSEAIAEGDPVALNSAGRVALYVAATHAKIMGFAASSVAATAAAGDSILVYDDPNQKFVAQISTGALTDPYTTMTVTGAFDITIATGASYINAAASTYDIIQVLEPSVELDTGEESAIGTYQKVVCKVNAAKHQFGGVA